MSIRAATLKTGSCVAEPGVTAVRIDPLKIKRVGIALAPGLLEDCRSGRRTYQIRHEWPMHVDLDGKPLYDEKHMRAGYIPLTQLLGPVILSAQDEDAAVLAARFNIPMNLGAGFSCLDGTGPSRRELRWSDDRDDVNAGIAMDPRNNAIFGADPLNASTPFEIRTSILALHGRFIEDVFIVTTYDPRHIVDLYNKTPQRHCDGTPKTYGEFMALANDPDNILLTNLARLFVTGSPHDYLNEAKRLIGIYGWSRYDRVVMALAGKDAPFAMEVYKFYRTTPPEIVNTVNRLTAIERPFIFGLTEGGSFGFGGTMDGREFVELGKPASYARGPEGLFAMYLITEASQFEAVKEANARMGSD